MYMGRLQGWLMHLHKQHIANKVDNRNNRPIHTPIRDVEDRRGQLFFFLVRVSVLQPFWPWLLLGQLSRLCMHPEKVTKATQWPV